MASGGTVKFDIEVTGYWQRCPVCDGRGIVPQGFHSYPAGQIFTSGHTGPDRCQRCAGTGTIKTPVIKD